MGPCKAVSAAEAEKKRWLAKMVEYIQPGKMVEFGCGSGFVLQMLTDSFPQSIIVGLDLARERLAKVNQRGLKNVITVCGDATKSIFPDESFDTALFVASLHEIYSYMGKRRVNIALRVAFRILKRGGMLVIEDFLKPVRREVELLLRNRKSRKRFLQFAEQFQPRTVRFKETPGGVELDIADAVEFISKYRSPNWRDWREEMRETHFFFTLKDYREALLQAGFRIEVVKELPRSPRRWAETKEDVGFNYEPEYKWVLVAAKK